MKHRSLALSAVALALVVPALMGASRQDEHTIRFKAPEGGKLTVTNSTKTKMTFSGMMDQEVQSGSDMTEEVIFDSAADGWTKFEMKTTEVKLTGESPMPGGGPSMEDMADMLKKVKITGEVDPMGKTRNMAMSGLNDDDMMARGMVEANFQLMQQVGFMGISWPEAPVKTGTKWNTEFDFSKVLEANSMGMISDVKGKIPTEISIEGFEQIDGKTYAKVQTFMDGKVTFSMAMGGGEGGNMTLTSKSMTWVDVTDGIPLKTDTNIAGVIDIGMMVIQQQMTSSSTVTRG